ncbi:unnamed protein product [Calypogeia fissa]
MLRAPRKPSATSLKLELLSKEELKWPHASRLYSETRGVYSEYSLEGLCSPVQLSSTMCFWLGSNWSATSF